MGKDGCSTCGSPLDAAQRWCVRCGARTATPWVDDVARAVAGVAPPAPAPAAGAPALRPLPPRRLRAGLAAACLAVGAVTGLAAGPSDGPGSAVAAAAPRSVLVVPDLAAPVTTPGPGLPGAPAVAAVPDLPDVSDGDATAPDVGTASDTTAATGESTADAAPAADTTTPDAETPDPSDGESPDAAPSPVAAAPSDERAWVLALTAQDGTAPFDAGSAAPTLIKLAAEGTLLTDVTPAGDTSLAGGLALLTGSAPASAADDCTPATCPVPAGTPSLVTQLADAGRASRAYVQGLGAPCRADGDDRVVPARDPLSFLLATCTTEVVDGSALISDREDPPALTWLVPDTAHDGRGPAGLAAADPYVNDVLTRVRTSATFRSGGLLAIVVDAPATPGAHTSVLLLGPGVPRGRRVATPATPAGVLRVLEDHLGLPPLAGAADPSSAALAHALTTTATTTRHGGPK